MFRDLFEFENRLTYEELCEYRDKLKDNGTYSTWGDVIVWLPIEVNGIKYGAELNLECDAGEDLTAIYLMRSNKDGDYDTDHDIFDEYSGVEIVKQFALDTVEEYLIEYMCQFVIACVETIIPEEKTFISDVAKMIDFFSFGKDEFLKSYSYLNEEEYDATKTYVKFINDLAKLREGVE